MKYTQRQIILLLLADNEGKWVEQWRLRGRATPRGFIGDEAKKRCREFFEAEATTAEVTFGNRTFYLERGEKDGYATIRCARVIPTFAAPKQAVLIS